MKKTLPLLAATLLLASQAHAQTFRTQQNYGYKEPGNLGTISVTLSGQCRGNFNYNITDVAVETSTPIDPLNYSNNSPKVSFTSELGNFQLQLPNNYNKDSIKFELNDKLIKVQAKSKERAALFNLFADRLNEEGNFADYIYDYRELRYTRVDFHNFYDRLYNDIKYDLECDDYSFVNKFSSIKPLFNSSKFKKSSSLNYSSAISNDALTTTTQLNTSFSGPLEQAATCSNTAPITNQSTAYSVSCKASAPITITVNFVINATETLTASDM